MSAVSMNSGSLPDGWDIGVATRAELDTLLEWAANEGWNPGLHDADAFWSADPQGFIVGRIDGRMVAGLSVVRGGSNHCFLGLYLCEPAYRGQGYGLAVWNEAMARRQGCVIGLDGVVAQQDNYRRSGFVFAHRNIRHTGVPVVDASSPAVTMTPDDADFDRLAAYDTRHAGWPRPDFLRSWCASGSGRHLRMLIRDGEIRGYGVIRACRSGHKIGPLFADDPEAAEMLFLSLARLAAGEPLSIDLPEPNAAALALARRHGLEPVFETARMYRGPAPLPPLERIYGITTFELG
jgi:GNAT superfamily N-acetyltransferase